MKLFYMPGACSLAAHIILEWIGEPYDTQRLSHAELKQPDFLRVNPQGSVPALQLNDGTVVTQNAAVLGYLADSHPQAGLYGDGTPRARADVHHWLGLLNSELHPAFRPLFGATGYLGDKDMIEKTKAHARQQVRTLFEAIDQVLAERDWLTGSRSIADPYLFAMTRWTDGVKIDVSDLAGLQRFRQRMEGDAAVRKALQAEGLS